MKSVVIERFGGPEVLEVCDQPIPHPGHGDVLIQVQATSLNYADVKARKGQYHNAGQPPFTPGLDVMGTVTARGDGVTTIEIGQRVIAFPLHGAHSQYALADAALTYALPDGVDAHAAAAFPTVGVTSYEVLHSVARLQPGETVLIHAAAGGVGTTALQLAKLAGAGRVIATVGSEEKRAIALQFGADEVINYETEPFADCVLDMTNGHGVDVILDSVAGEVLAQGLRCLARFGRLVVFGNASGEPGLVSSYDLHGSCRSVLGYSMGTTRRYRPDALRPSVDAALRLLADGQLRMHIGATFALSEIADAHRLLESRHSVGKILLLP